MQACYQHENNKKKQTCLYEQLNFIAIYKMIQRLLRDNQLFTKNVLP